METVTDTGSNVARVNKVRAGLLPLRQPVKSQIGRNGKTRKYLRLAEWNVRTLLDRNSSKRPERQCYGEIGGFSHNWVCRYAYKCY